MLHEFKDGTSQDTGHDMNYFKRTLEKISSSTVIQTKNKNKFADLGFKHFTNVIKFFYMFLPCWVFSALLSLIHFSIINKMFGVFFCFLLLRLYNEDI